MDTIDSIVITYIKLKQNLIYNFLAFKFDCLSDQQCKNIFLRLLSYWVNVYEW